MMSPDFSKVQAVFFDLDDTLCAYWEAARIGLRRAFEHHGPAGYTAEEMIHFWGIAFREFAPSLKKTDWYARYLVDGGSTRLEQMRRTLVHANCGDLHLAQKLADAYAEERDAHLRLFDDAVSTLTTLKAKYPLGLITNGPADVQRQEISTLGIVRFFDHVFIEGEMGIGKPEPEVFRRAEAAVGLAPDQILFVGNSYGHDIQPAIENRWRSAWVRRPSDLPPSTSLPEHKPEGAPEPDVEIGDLRSLLQWL